MRHVVLIGLVAVAGGCANPRTEANVAQALSDAANEISGLKNDIAQLQTEVDSLRTTLIRQDSAIARVAAAANVQIPK